MDEKPIKPIPEDKRPNGDTGKPADTDKPAVIPVPVGKIDAKRDSPDAHTEHKKRKSEPLSRMEIWTIGLAIAGIAVAAGTGIAIVWQDVLASRTVVELQKQLPELQKSANAAKDAADAAKKSFDMDKLRAEDTEEAICDWQTGGPAVGATGQEIRFANTGKTKARNIDAHLEATLNAVSNQKQIRKLGKIDISADELDKEKSLIRWLDFHFATHDWDNIADTKQMIVLTMSAQYDNGFDRLMKNSRCEIWVWYRVPGNKLNPVQGMGSDCNRLPDILANIARNQQSH
jgi:hypothetical protein